MLTKSLSIELIDREQKGQVFEEEREDVIANRNFWFQNQARTTRNTRNLDFVSGKAQFAIATSNTNI